MLNPTNCLSVLISTPACSTMAPAIIPTITAKGATTLGLHAETIFPEVAALLAAAVALATRELKEAFALETALPLPGKLPAAIEALALTKLVLILAILAMDDIRML